MSACAHMGPHDFCAVCAGEKLVEARAEVERVRAELRTERLLWQNTMHAQALEAKARLAKVVEALKLFREKHYLWLHPGESECAACEVTIEVDAALAAAQPEEQSHG